MYPRSCSQVAEQDSNLAPSEFQSAFHCTLTVIYTGTGWEESQVRIRGGKTILVSFSQ